MRYDTLLWAIPCPPLVRTSALISACICTILQKYMEKAESEPTKNSSPKTGLLRRTAFPAELSSFQLDIAGGLLLGENRLRLLTTIHAVPCCHSSTIEPDSPNINTICFTHSPVPRWSHIPSKPASVISALSSAVTTAAFFWATLSTVVSSNGLMAGK